MQLRSVVGKKVNAVMVGKKCMTILLLSGHHLYLQSYTIDNFTVTLIWIFYLFHDFVGL